MIFNIDKPVVESGTTGIWKWKKYSDNTVEFFGKIPLATIDINTAFSGWYRSSYPYESNSYEYPFTMTEAPALVMMFQTRNGNGAITWPYSQSAELAQRYVPQCYLIRPTAATNVSGNINIIGRGKI